MQLASLQEQTVSKAGFDSGGRYTRGFHHVISVHALIDGCCDDLIPQTTSRINLNLSFERNNQIGCKKRDMQNQRLLFLFTIRLSSLCEAYVNKRIPYVWNSAE